MIFFEVYPLSRTPSNTPRLDILTDLLLDCIVSMREGNTIAKTKKGGTGKIHRSSITGRFVKSGTAKRHPKTTTTETVRKPKKK